MSCPARLGLLPAINNKAVDSVMMPKPPNWIRNRITHCPKRLKALPVSTTVRPVTQTAEVAVKRAFMKPRRWPVEAEGNIRSKVPTAISRMNPPTEIRAGDLRSDWEIRLVRILK